MNNENNRILAVDWLRGFSAVMLVFGHSLVMFPSNVENEIVNTIHSVISSFNMPLFFIIAGFVWHVPYDRKQYYKKKVFRILIPFFVWGTLMALCYALPFADKFVASGRIPFLLGIRELLAGQGNYWFLYTIFEIFIIYPLFHKIAENTLYRFLTVFLFLLVETLFDFPQILHLNSFVKYFPYFVFGDYLKTIMQAVKKQFQYSTAKERAFALSLGALLFGSGYLIVYSLSDNNAFSEFFCGISFSCFLIIICIALISFTDFSKTVVSRFLKKCSIYSLQLYLLNHFIMTPLRYVLYKYLGVSNVYMRAIICTIASIGMTLMSCQYIIEKSDILCIACGIVQKNEPQRNASIDS